MNADAMGLVTEAAVTGDEPFWKHWQVQAHLWTCSPVPSGRGWRTPGREAPWMGVNVSDRGGEGGAQDRAQAVCFDQATCGLQLAASRA